jgi:hypothetical protein
MLALRYDAHKHLIVQQKMHQFLHIIGAAVAPTARGRPCPDSKVRLFLRHPWLRSLELKDISNKMSIVSLGSRSRH